MPAATHDIQLCRLLPRRFSSRSARSTMNEHSNGTHDGDSRSGDSAVICRSARRPFGRSPEPLGRDRAFLQRDIRTVQRWESKPGCQCLGMPRLAFGPLSPIVRSSMRGGTREPTVECEVPGETPAPPSPWSPRRTSRVAAGAGGATSSTSGTPAAAWGNASVKSVIRRRMALVSGAASGCYRRYNRISFRTTRSNGARR